MSLSGWCSGLEGCTSKRAHNTCQERQNKGLLDACNCESWGGHFFDNESKVGHNRETG